MKELNDLFKVIADGKKQAIESNPGKKLLHQLKEELHTDNPFLVKSESKPNATRSKPLTEDIIAPIFQSADIDTVINEVLSSKEIDTEIISDGLSTPQIRPASQFYAQADIDKYLRQNASFQQPNPDKPDPTIQGIQDKVKFLEQAIGKIAAHGPGSGETWFRWLDDVNRATIDVPEADQEHVLRYDASTKKFFFGELTGDHREINSFTFDKDGPGITNTPRMLYWNENEDCLQVDQEDGTSCSIGLENYIQIRNNSGSTLENGSVVRFSGAYSNGDHVPEAILHIADGSIPPLYTIGVVTDSIDNESLGRVTVLGKVRDVNTTGSDVNETWQVGDILYVHPTLPGKMTKFKPTAPQVVISVAAVLKKDTDTGILLVRPTIFPRLFYGTFSAKTNQLVSQINTPYAVQFDTTQIANGHRIGSVASQIIAENSGLYNYKFSIQLVSTNSSAKDVYIWFRKNGVDIPDSASRKTITGNGVYDVVAWDITVSMQPNDYFEIMWAATDTTVSIAAPAATTFCPAIPSVLLTVSEIAL